MQGKGKAKFKDFFAKVLGTQITAKKMKMNANSSQSHSVLMLHLCGTQKVSDATLQGELYFCDLAGSEKSDSSKNCEETTNINGALLN